MANGKWIIFRCATGLGPTIMWDPHLRWLCCNSCACLKPGLRCPNCIVFYQSRGWGTWLQARSTLQFSHEEGFDQSHVSQPLKNDKDNVSFERIFCKLHKFKTLTLWQYPARAALGHFATLAICSGTSCPLLPRANKLPWRNAVSAKILIKTFFLIWPSTFSIWPSTFSNSAKYIFQFSQGHFPICTDTFCNKDS